CLKPALPKCWHPGRDRLRPAEAMLRLPCRLNTVVLFDCLALGESMQFSRRHHELCEAAIQTDHRLGEYPDGGLLQAVRTGKVNRNLTGEFTVVVGSAPFTGC